jgi:hypothetical protein
MMETTPTILVRFEVDFTLPYKIEVLSGVSDRDRQRIEKPTFKHYESHVKYRGIRETVIPYRDFNTKYNIKISYSE